MAATEENIVCLFLNGCACDKTAEQLKTERTSITRVTDECVGTNCSGARELQSDKTWMWQWQKRR
jgi:hypothetical protein